MSSARALGPRKSVYPFGQTSKSAHALLIWHTLLSLFTVGLWSTPLIAETRKYCYQKVLEPGATGGGKVRVNGFTVEVKPNISDYSGYMACHATVTSPQGSVVYESEDWGMEIDPITGKDVNGDAQPDAVLVSFSGGAHCCWTYHIISLGQNPGLVSEFENRSNASFKDIRGDGHVQILIRDGSFDFAFGLDHAFSVFPLLVVELRGNKFVDVSPQFWPTFENEIRRERGKLTDKGLQEFLHSDPGEVHDSLAYQETKSAVLFILLEYLYAGRRADGRRNLEKMWPAESREKIWREMLSGYCTGLRASLDLESPAICASQLR